MNGDEGKIAYCEYNKRCGKVALQYVIHKTKIIKVCSNHLRKFPKK